MTYTSSLSKEMNDAIDDIISIYAEFDGGQYPDDPAGYYPIGYQELTTKEQNHLSALTIESGENWVNYISDVDMDDINRLLLKTLRLPTRENMEYLGEILVKKVVESFGDLIQDSINYRLSNFDYDDEPPFEDFITTDSYDNQFPKGDSI